MKHSKAYVVAQQALHSCTVPEGIIAGTHHFVDLWARDALFATFGANVSGQQEASAQTIETFLRFQRSDGLVPYRILRSPTSWNKYRGRPTYFAAPRPNYRSHQSGGLVPDGGLLAVIAAREYGQQTGDKTRLGAWYEQLSRAMAWYTKRGEGTLVGEWVQCEWADSILKAGHVLYTNVLYWKALGDMAWISGETNNRNEKKKFLLMQARIGEAINKTFWNGTYFADWVDWRRQDYFSSLSNMLAVVFGLADAEQSRLILAFAKAHCVKGWTLETNYPAYPIWRVQPLNYLVGMGDYQNRGCLWMQPGLLYAIALKRTGKAREAQAVFGQIERKINEFGSVFEVYEKTGEPVQRPWYTSEYPFAWSAGLFLWTYHILNTYE